MKKLIITTAMVASLALSACANGPNGGYTGVGGYGAKESVGTLGGAVIGGVLGAQVGKGDGRLWATGAGALIGAMFGNQIGKSLDRADLMYAQQATVKAYDAPIGQTINWNNPESGNYGTVTPTREGRDANNGGYCREYNQTIYVGGKQESAYGTACQRPDGSWEIVS